MTWIHQRELREAQHTVDEQKIQRATAETATARAERELAASERERRKLRCELRQQHNRHVALVTRHAKLESDTLASARTGAISTSLMDSGGSGDRVTVLQPQSTVTAPATISPERQRGRATSAITTQGLERIQWQQERQRVSVATTAAEMQRRCEKAERRASRAEAQVRCSSSICDLHCPSISCCRRLWRYGQRSSGRTMRLSVRSRLYGRAIVVAVVALSETAAGRAAPRHSRCRRRFQHRQRG